MLRLAPLLPLLLAAGTAIPAEPAPMPHAGRAPAAPARPALPQVRVAGVQVGVVPTFADAVLLADADSATIPPGDAPFQRYVWVVSGDPDDAKAVALTANYPSHATTIIRPRAVSAAGVLLMRLDLRAYAPRDEQLQEFLKLWEDYQNDPRASLLITKDTLVNARVFGDAVPVVKVNRRIEKRVEKVAASEEWRTEVKVFEHKGGVLTLPDDTGRSEGEKPAGYYERELKFRTVKPAEFEVKVVEEQVEVKLTDVKDVDLVRLPGRHLPARAFADLTARLRTAAPVVSHDYWIARHLSTIRDKGLFAELYGGRYYQFMLFRRGQEGATDEDLIFESLGLGNVKAGQTAAKLFEAVRSDQRVGMFKSGVTGKPRRIDFFRSPSNRDGTGVVSVTHDTLDKSIDVGQHAMMNLIEFRDDGREGIFEQRNGLHGFYIADGRGRLVDEAPPDLVADHTIPAPHGRRLQPAISCIRCHGAARDDGWKPAQNQVKLLIEKSKRLDVLGDTTNRAATVPDTLDRLAGLYGGDPERKLLPRARDDYAEAVLRATGPWAGSKDQADAVNLAGARLSKIWADRHYQMVTPVIALRELGLVAAEQDAPAVLDAVLPPSVEDAALGAVPEDVRIGALLVGLPINRVDWDLVYGFAAPRAQRALQRLQQPQQKGKK